MRKTSINDIPLLRGGMQLCITMQPVQELCTALMGGQLVC